MAATPCAKQPAGKGHTLPLHQAEHPAASGVPAAQTPRQGARCSFRGSQACLKECHECLAVPPCDSLLHLLQEDTPWPFCCRNVYVVLRAILPVGLSFDHSKQMKKQDEVSRQAVPCARTLWLAYQASHQNLPYVGSKSSLMHHTYC